MGLFGKKDKDEFRDDVTDSSEEREIELREEELRAEKRRVEAGEVRLRKEVVEEQKTLNVPVTREEVVVEKHSVEGRRPADGSIGDDEEIRIPVMEEEVRVEKTPVVREEVSLRKRQVQDTEKISETVKREEAWVDRTEDAQVRSGMSDWGGPERRSRATSNYGGPERRVATL
ncbi:MAG TPA: YsnF/AvaK domain-containing protein [Gemmatimonadales bacterium]|nr:YsnF/AvaK domain-containing protein [Gemmatimonadales bacterium]